MLHALMPTRNEVSRYVLDVIDDLEELAIPVLVCDDQSTDDTREAIWSGSPNATVVTRPDEVPSFLQHEGYFRQWCWEQLHAQGVGRGDLVLCIDADEYLVPADAFNPFLESSVYHPHDTTAWDISVVEIWGWSEDGAPMMRTDGFWGKGRQAKLAAWVDDLSFPDRPMASGAIPTAARAVVSYTPLLTLVHYGYARSEDRQAKYARYKEHPFGHSSQHIESILTRPSLKEYVER